ncbi:MAG: hypothetical protein HN952_04745 [Candidatus Cloacimonetes bacterium]|jgi:lipopolysaccharide export system protein LptA|nr:hypothetical protein [Candidatus Cloacimonadota bacterium]MBT6994248.1 hypothetical protein [Candidatus Cloacimonadota bacterium]MBT7470020.1 hypothetical protein [Candidatus Cloacimonadota bacterium]
MKSLIGKFLVIFVLFSLMLFAENHELQSYKLINADTLIVQNINDEYISNLIGNVHFFYGETEFFADKADIYEQQKIVRLWHNVRVYEDTLSLLADKVNYFRKTEKLFLDNNVKIEEIGENSHRIFKADFAKYFRNENILYATNQVSFLDLNENIVGNCGKLTYLITDNYGYLTESPKICFTEKDTFSIVAEKIEYFGKNKKITATFNVKTFTNEIEINSDFLLYFSAENKAIYQGQPKMFSEFADAFATEFQIYFSENNIENAQLFNSCKVLFKTIENSKKISWVTADKMNFVFDDARIKFCNAENNVISYFQQEKNVSQNEAKGDKLKLKISDDNKIDVIQLIENAGGLYRFQQK